MDDLNKREFRKWAEEASQKTTRNSEILRPKCHLDRLAPRSASWIRRNVDQGENNGHTGGWTRPRVDRASKKLTTALCHSIGNRCFGRVSPYAHGPALGGMFGEEGGERETGN